MEFQCSDSTAIRLDQDIGRSLGQSKTNELLLNDFIGPVNDSRRAPRMPGSRRRPQTYAPVDRDRDHGAAESFPGDIRRERIDETAIDEKLVSLPDGREDTGDGDARSHGDAERTAVDDDLFPGLQIRCDGNEGDGQIFDPPVAEVLGEESDNVLPGRKSSAGKVGKKQLKGLPAPGRSHDKHDLFDRHAARVKGSDLGSNARSDNRPHGNSLPVEHIENAHVRDSACASSSEGQNHAGLSRRHHSQPQRSSLAQR